MPNNKMERFTQRARRVMSLAQEEAERLHHNYIGTEHMLLGLLREEGGVAGRVLRDLGLEQHKVEELVDELTRATARTTETTAELSPGIKRVLELSVDEARRMGHHYIGTEHMLLGLVRQSEGVAIDVLKRFGIRPEEVRRQTRRILQESPVQTQSPPPSSFSSAQGTQSTLTEKSGQVLTFAREYVDQFQLITVDPEHLLVGLLREEKGVAGQVLRNLGVEQKRMEELVEELTHAMPRTTPTNPELSNRTKRVLEFAVDEARRMGDHLINTQHLLLGLVRQSEGVTIEVLKRLGVSPEEVRRQTWRVLQEAPVQPNLGTQLDASPAAVPAQRQPMTRLPADAYELLENILMKILDMIEAGKLPVAQAVELFSTLTPDLRIPSTLQNQLTGKFFDALLQQYLDKQKFGDYKVHLTTVDSKGTETFNHLDLPLTTLLTEIERFLAAVRNDPTTPMVFTLGDTSLEVRIEKSADDANE
ncbi:MAG: hypothetical protein H0X30_00755 [Anaerolineae bacterium]|nr:hypothetical protein [Anaerolineae bacterium]